ncbi:hypothetical protein MLD38_029119 [Melastoma candidum]|uniref:Uncharacterized protein n=1 Tax=Melastoma candidum TaxID=119954 RepID=A0ACB9N3M5_9MYRT|nr:hypothetical protein MLD38_029119 [Melastoma candidum]
MPAARDDVSEEKVVVNLPLGPPVDDLKASVVVERKTKSLIPFTVFRFRLWCSFTYKNVCSSEELDVTEPAEEKRPRGPVDRGKYVVGFLFRLHFHD